uniref:class I SAM-dependent rRNA methyltransferase n=1 Tax=Candidatus Enterococcus willemsii TaxID=1857215 RepID=UPI00403FA317
MKIKLTQQAIKKIKKNYPLIQKEDLKTETMTNEWVTFTDSIGQFVAKGYLGKQNKGIGWILTREDCALDHRFFVKRFALAKTKRQAYYEDELTTAFRVVNGEGDELGGLIIDVYENFAVFSWYNDTLYHKREYLISAFKEVFPEIRGAYEKIRFDSTLPESQFIYGEKAPEPLIVKENGISYATYMNEGLMTGIFLDQREVRGLLAEGFASGQTVLNMFSYTGAFSVAAAMGGATQTTSVDLAKRSLPKTKEQFAVNGLDEQAQKIHVMDTFDYFKYAKKKGLSFDVIILDPPSFARNKKKVFSVAKNYGELIEDSVDILTHQGVIIASTNAANLAPHRFQQMIETALTQKGVKFEQIAQYRLPADFAVCKGFPEGDYLKVFFYRIAK